MFRKTIALCALLFASIASAQMTTSLTALSAAPASGDLFRIVDISDTTMAGTGTNKKLTVSYLFTTPVITGAITAVGPGHRFEPATTANSLHDTMFSSSANTQAALAVQATATPTISPFIVEGSNGTNWFEVQSDGGVIIDQRTGATYSRILDVKYQGVWQYYVTYDGIAYAKKGFNGGEGFFTTDQTGNVVALGNITGKHLLGNGTSPTVADNGGNDSTIAGKDTGHKVTVGTGTTTAVTVTFGTAYATAPACVASATVSSDIKVATTTTTVVLTHAGFSDAEVLHVVCIGF